MRLLHVCLSDELFSEFLQRDKKLTRTQLDGKAKNSFWHSVAITFCDPSKTFDLIDFPGVESDRYTNLKAGLLPTNYALTAEKAKQEFGNFRTLYSPRSTRGSSRVARVTMSMTKRPPRKCRRAGNQAPWCRFLGFLPGQCRH